MWSYGPLGVTALYLEHFQYLLVDSKHRRFNLLRTFQKSAMIRKLLYALRSGLFDAAVVPVVVGKWVRSVGKMSADMADTLKFALEVRWSSEDSIKPVFSYLVTALCQSEPALRDEENLLTSRHAKRPTPRAPAITGASRIRSHNVC
jgi:hypothetical protein